MPAAKDGKKLLKMKLLARVCDVDDFAWSPGFKPIRQRSKVGSRVIKGAIALPNKSGAVFELRTVLKKHRHSALAFTGDAFADQPLNNRAEAQIVEAFAQGVI